MKTALNLTFSLSKAIWILCVAVFLSIAFRENQGMEFSGLEIVKIGFAVVSVALTLIHLLACFAPPEEQDDLSILSAEFEAPEPALFPHPWFQKVVSILGDLSSALMYTLLMLFVLVPAMGLLPFILFGLLPKALFFFLGTFASKQAKTDLGKLFPELRK